MSQNNKIKHVFCITSLFIIIMNSSGFSQQNKSNKAPSDDRSYNDSQQYYPSGSQGNTQNKFAYPSNSNTQNPNYFVNMNANNNQFINNPQGQYLPQQNGTNIPHQNQGYPAFQNVVNPQQIPYNQPNNYPNPNQKQKILIPQSSIIRKYSLTQVSKAIQKNINQVPEDFKKKWLQVQYFGDVTQNSTLWPLMLSCAYVFLNSRKKWFKLTANFKLIRFNIGYLSFVLLTSKFLQINSAKVLISQNLMTVESLMAKEEASNKSSFIN